MDLLTPRQAAARLGVTYSTVKQWIYKGAVRTRPTAGGHHRIPQTEIDRLLAGVGREFPSLPPRASAGVIVSLSGRNQLRGLVEEVRVDGLLAQVRLRIGDQRLTAVITRDAVEDLGLRRGDEALAVIKATEVMIGRAGESASRAPARTASRTRPARRRR
jgi:molybdopterin-binding protein